MTTKRLSSMKSTLTRGKSRTLDTPWTSPTMSDNRPSTSRSIAEYTRDPAMPEPTVAVFSPGQQTSTRHRNQASVIIHQKSPLLVATPPQVTRALAYSHPFILPLNHLAGLISWTTGDPWESFLFLCGFWFTTLYAGTLLRWIGPIVLVAALVLFMHTRRFSPLSSTAWTGDKKSRQRADSDSQQRKSLDEILDTLQSFTNRCDILLDPFIRLTEFLSTQVSATSATTRPALTSMFVRLLAVTPVWFLLTLPPLRIVTARRVVLVLGTIIFSWHSQAVRATRALLWRSRSIRSFCSVITGLNFNGTFKTQSPFTGSDAQSLAAKKAGNQAGAGVRFTFALYENQRKWVAIGYSSNLFPNERNGWTDEHLNATPHKDDFPLPETDSETHKWRWVSDSKWKVDYSWSDDRKTVKSAGDKEGWTYYDNKWHIGGKAEDWGKWTRRRRWIRDAELIEIPASVMATRATVTPATSTTTLIAASANGISPSSPSSLPKTPVVDISPNGTDGVIDNSDSASVISRKKKSWFGKRKPTGERGSS